MVREVQQSGASSKWLHGYERVVSVGGDGERTGTRVRVNVLLIAHCGWANQITSSLTKKSN